MQQDANTQDENTTHSRQTLKMSEASIELLATELAFIFHTNL
jgi:hypothetical protein